MRAKWSSYAWQDERSLRLRRSWRALRATSAGLTIAAITALVWCIAVGWWWLGLLAFGILGWLAAGTGSEAHAEWARLIRSERKHRAKVKRDQRRTDT